MNRQSTTIYKVKDLPQEEHWAVLVEESLRYDDGYGDNGSSSYSTMNYLSYVTFESESVLQEWIVKNDETTYGKKVFSVIKVKPAKVVKSVKIDVGFE